MWARGAWCVWFAVLCWASTAQAQPAAAPATTPTAPTGLIDITLQSRVWLEPTGDLTIEQVVQREAEFAPLTSHQAFQLRGAALWMRFELPELDPSQRWYLMLDGGAFTDRAYFHQQDAANSWRVQVAGFERWGPGGVRQPLIVAGL